MQRTPQTREDLLDVIFMNRNKAYGAYVLRKEYDQTMVRSFLYCLAFISAAAIWLYLRNPEDNTTKPVMLGKVITLGDEPVYINAPEQPKSTPAPELPRDEGGPQAGPGSGVQITRGATTFTASDSANLGSGGDNGQKGASGGGSSGSGGSTGGGGSDSVPNTGNTFKPLDYSEDPAEFPGGINAMKKFIAENLDYPLEAKRAGKDGKVVLRFVVNTNGEIDHIESLNSIQGFGMEEEARRVLGLMPKWKPGRQNGHAVSVYYVLPIRFKLE